jgi:RNA polymerase sigma-70 factor (ECF subfamily)
MAAESASPTFEAELVAKIQGGQSDAEADLYRRYSARVYYLALRETRSPQDAEDVRAETFLRVLQAIRGNHLRSASSVAAFIVGTTRNVLHEFQRRCQAENADQFRAPEASVPSHERLLLDSDVRSAVEQTIARLKPRERKLLRLYYYEELPRNEIARHTGIAEERVRLVKSRALKHFREIYTRLNAGKKTDTNCH